MILEVWMIEIQNDGFHFNFEKKSHSLESLIAQSENRVLPYVVVTSMSKPIATDLTKGNYPRLEIVPQDECEAHHTKSDLCAMQPVPQIDLESLVDR